MQDSKPNMIHDTCNKKLSFRCCYGCRQVRCKNLVEPSKSDEIIHNSKMDLCHITLKEVTANLILHNRMYKRVL